MLLVCLANLSSFSLPYIAFKTSLSLLFSNCIYLIPQVTCNKYHTSRTIRCKPVFLWNGCESSIVKKLEFVVICVLCPENIGAVACVSLL